MLIHLIIRGNVQGVGFRARSCLLARQLTVFGTVQNLEDGSVEIYSQGTPDQLNHYLQNLQRAFRTASFQQTECSEERSYSSFSIIR